MSLVTTSCANGAGAIDIDPTKVLATLFLLMFLFLPAARATQVAG